jgi:biopolymer transport protein TolR
MNITKASTPLPVDDIMVEYFADKRIEINHQPVTLEELEERLREIYRPRVNKTLYIAGDGTLRYGEIVAVIDASKGAGVDRVGIITEGMRRSSPP